MTEKLFYEDSHMRTFTAVVLECGPVGEGALEASAQAADTREGERDPEASGRTGEIPEEKRYQIVLDRTAFFPEGGGQYADTGQLQADSEVVRVLDVQERDGKIFHITDRPVLAGSTVSGQIDWAERFMKMQQHTGEHIVSGLVHARFGYDNVGFHLGSTDCTMDFNGEITREELHEIELRANEAAAANLDIQVSYPSGEELAGLEYRSKIEIEGQVRIVTIPGFDVCACCAPHVKKTGEIGVIKLTNVQRYKGGVRVTMLCGSRALADYDRKSMSVRRISASLCAKEDEVAEAVEHLKEECARLKARLAEQQKEMLWLKARESDGEKGAVCLFESGLEGDGPRLLMNLVMERGHELCAVFCGNDEEGYRYVIGSAGLDLRKLVKELNAAFSGRGGGKPEMVQGSLKGTESELRAWMQMHGAVEK
nr:alanine--tRNA ligase-related protein [uncultured Schaedlerella sp.]